MSAYFDGPPSFFPGQAASAAPLPGLEEAAEHSGPVQRERPVVPQQVTVGGRKVNEVLVGTYFFFEHFGEDGGEGVWLKLLRPSFFSLKKTILGKFRFYNPKLPAEGTYGNWWGRHFF